MRTAHLTLWILLISLAGPASAQDPAHAHDSATPSVSGDAKQAFDALKALAGSWVGRLTTTPPAPDVDGRFVQFSLQVTSRGNALLHEMSVAGLPDHPVTLFYVDKHLTLTHYCDAGNRPRMVGRLSPDGKTLEFEFLLLSGSNEHGHMHRAVFTFIDENHHTEEWTYMMPGDKPMRARFDLQRTNFEASSR